MRVKAVIAYDGSRFYGFQRQPDVMTVAGCIEKALRALNIDSPVIGSGRTDRGVHATGQVVHIDIPPYWNDPEKLRLHLNLKLDGIVFKKIISVSSDFHARFHAKRRLYRYIFKLDGEPSVFQRNYVAYYDRFDEERLRKALSLFTGTHDFAAFQKTGSQPEGTVRTIYRADYYRYGHYGIIRFVGNAFLRSQVRLMTEAAMCYAKNRLSYDALCAQLHRQVPICRLPAPAEGLYLSRIYY
jgi:tRNA pseudouridine38-40 synthase